MHGDKRGFDTTAQPSRQKAAEKVLSDQFGESLSNVERLYYRHLRKDVV
jgi:hypothetical protein